MSAPSQAAQDPPPRPRADPSVEEVRVAMALNGGVSLAIWMGGCAVELDRARRAGESPGSPARIYDALCECFGRRLVIDVLAGASAGGVNGGLLGAAMVTGRQLDPDFVRRRWLDLGDLSKLLHETGKPDPTALMDGEMFHRELLATFRGVLGTDSRAPGYKESACDSDVPPEIPCLDVTMTDVIGVERRFRDTWGGELLAREHRPRFKFREAAHFTPEALAAAARTSASFPFAFEPWRVAGNPRILAGLPGATYGIDGGLLDNAPIRAALDSIPFKPATSRVRRYVCYLNGDPIETATDMDGPAAPGLREVGAHVVNLPRVAPFVDQLYAIQRAVERPKLAGKVGGELLRLGRDELRAVAGALLGTYRQRRTLQSLEELLPEPGDARAVDSLLAAVGGRLPWVPDRLEPPRPGEWPWGVRPAQRILHLMLDILRPAIRRAPTDRARRELLERRIEIDAQMTVLIGARDQLVGPRGGDDLARWREERPVDRLRKAADKASRDAPAVRAAVKKAADSLLRGMYEQANCFDAWARQALFGAEPTETLSEEMFCCFLERVLAIEVVRRALAAETDIDSAEDLRFVQLTPTAPAPLFTPAPLSLPVRAAAREKLTGVDLAHFAAFYRRSWRANDFMWGRLDASARIVDLLLDAPSREVGKGTDAPTSHDRAVERAELLVAALLSGPHEAEQRWLLEEALDDAAGRRRSARRGVTDRVDPAAGATLRIAAELEAAEQALDREEPAGVNTMPFTRAVLQRAAQLEVAVAELPEVRRESSRDLELGCAGEPLRLGGVTGAAEAKPAEEIRSVRQAYRDGKSLPALLTGDEEAVSDLGLQTISHASLVSLSAMRTAGVPMSKVFGLARTPLLAIAGTVARSWPYRLTVLLGFWAASIYLTSRLVTADGGEVTFGDIWSWPTVAALVAALGVAGVAAVPLLRATRGVNALRNSGYAAALAGSAVGVAAALAWIAGDLDSVPRLLFTHGAEEPSKWLILGSLVLMGLVSVARLPLPSLVARVFGFALRRLRSGAGLCAALLVAFGLIAIPSLPALWNGFDAGTWQAIATCLALAGAPIAAAIAVSIWELRLPTREPAATPKPTEAPPEAEPEPVSG